MKTQFLLIVTALFAQVSLTAQFTSGPLVPVGISGVSARIDTTPTLVTVTLSGPSNSFLGIGFGAVGQGMSLGRDGFIYNAASTRDYTFQGIGIQPQADANQDWTVTSNIISGSTRTVVATRSLTGSPEDITIPNAAGTLDVFAARGNNTLTLSNHGAANRDYATLVMGASLATGEMDMKNKLQLYPNPVQGILFLKYPGKVQQITLYDAAGNRVMNPKLQNDQMDVSKLNSGTYYLEIESEKGEKAFEKFIKQ